MNNRYSRHVILSEIGESGQKKINSSKVLVIGSGGLGCPVLQYLAAAGVGTIGIVDNDTVDISNLQRQVLFGKSALGMNKAEAAKERLSDINDELDYQIYPVKLTNRNALDIVSKYDIVVDGTDNFATRYLINDACVILGKPLVYGSIFKFEGQVSVFNYKGGATYRCLFPSPPDPGTVPSCSEVGVLGVLPGLIGTMQANEVLKIILGLGDVLSGKLMMFNALTLESQSWNILANSEQIEELKQETSLLNKDYEEFCGFGKSDIEILISDVKNPSDFTWVDIRNEYEVPRTNLPDVIEVPLDELSTQLYRIPTNKPIVFICQKGMRSRLAVEIFEKEKSGRVKSFSLHGGVGELSKSLLKE